MFSYTDDAIVTSSPTGRHLSTVIRHPAGMPDDQWRKHADQVCTVLNELKAGDALIDAGKIASDYQSRNWTLYAGVQTVGRIKRSQPCAYDLADPHGPTFAELIDAVYLAPQPRQPMPSADPQREENLALRRKLDDATTKLCAAQMLLEKPVRLTADDVLRILSLETDTAIEVDGRTLARVE